MFLACIHTNEISATEGQYLCIPLGDDFAKGYKFVRWSECIPEVKHMRSLDGSFRDIICNSIVHGRDDVYAAMCNTIFGQSGYKILDQICIMYGVQISATCRTPGQPLFVSGEMAYEAEAVETRCAWYCDSIGQLPDFSAAVHWHLGILQRSVLMGRRERENGIIPMEPAGVKAFFRDSVPQAFNVFVDAGWWLPARLRDSSGTFVEDVLLEIRSRIFGGFATVRIWFREAQCEIKRDMEIWRELEWDEFSQWDAEGEPTGEACKWRSKVCLGKIVSVAMD